MTVETPTSELDPQFSSPDATPMPWPQAQERLEKAQVSGSRRCARTGAHT